MKVREAKDLLEQLLHSSGWCIDEIYLRHPDLVRASQSIHKNEIFTYRVIKIANGEKSEIRPHTVSSTSSELISTIDIQDSMPSIIFSESGTINFDSHYMRFNIPNDKILLDIDNIVLPAIKKKLEKVKNHKIEGKSGEFISISRAIELYEKSGENEIICDLTDLKPEGSITIGSSVNGKYMTSKIRAFSDKKSTSIEHTSSELDNNYHTNQEVTETAKKILSPKDFSLLLSKHISDGTLKISREVKREDTAFHTPW